MFDDIGDAVMGEGLKMADGLMGVAENKALQAASSMLAEVDGSESWMQWGLHKAEDAALGAAEAAAWSMMAQAEAEDVDAIVDQVGALSLDEVAKAGEDLWNELAQTEAQRRRRGGRSRGGRGKKRRGGGWGKTVKDAAKDAGKSIGTSMAEDAAWCAMGDPLNVVGCK